MSRIWSSISSIHYEYIEAELEKLEKMPFRRNFHRENWVLFSKQLCWLKNRRHLKTFQMSRAKVWNVILLVFIITYPSQNLWCFISRITCWLPGIYSAARLSWISAFYLVVETRVRLPHLALKLKLPLRHTAGPTTLMIPKNPISEAKRV